MRMGALAVLLLTAAAGSLPAQAVADRLRPDSAALERLAGAGSVRITASGRRWRAPGAAVTGAGIRIGADSILPWSAVGRAEVVHSSIGTGAAVGGAVGALLGFAAGMAATAECTCSGGFCFEICGAGGDEVVAATFVTAGAGALLGLLIALPFPGWSTVYDSVSGTGARTPPRVVPIVMRSAEGEHRIGLSVRWRY